MNPENTVFDAKQLIGRKFADAAVQSDIKDITVYLTGVSCALSTYSNVDKAVRAKVFGDFKLPVEVAESTCDLCFAAANSIEADEVEVEEGQDLCNCVFTLGYGSLILLNNTRLYLKRGGNYGLLGPDDCGKTTLMRAINSEQVEGFPPKSELKPTSGTISKIPGRSVAYMSQHAFHDTENHLDFSATQYIMQRFAGGEDNESLENLANIGATKENENKKAKRMFYKKGGLVECETMYDDKGELQYQKKSLEKAVDMECIANRSMRISSRRPLTSSSRLGAWSLLR